jgi:2-keto-4-pentenoate hydratase/2-oxohepta-3-ene-1,7-dioic acid hydratase in catechol pathway
VVPHIWSGAAHLDSPGTPISPEIDTFRYWVLGSPAPAPGQLFAIGLNYRAHESESGFAIPEDPPVFTKFVSSITGPHHRGGSAALRHTDWEVELVVTVGAEA